MATWCDKRKPLPLTPSAIHNTYTHMQNTFTPRPQSFHFDPYKDSLTPLSRPCHMVLQKPLPSNTVQRIYLEAKSEHFNFSREKFEGKNCGKNNPWHPCRPRQRIGDEIRSWQFKSRGVQAQRCCWPTKWETEEAWHLCETPSRELIIIIIRCYQWRPAASKYQRRRGRL